MNNNNDNIGRNQTVRSDERIFTGLCSEEKISVKYL